MQSQSEEKKEEKKEDNQPNDGLLIQLNDYLASGIHIGMQFKSGFMKKHIFKTREDGLGVLNVSQINERLRLAANMIAQYEPSEVLVLGRRDVAKKPISMFSKLTGIKAVIGRYYPGTITNPSLKKFMEAKLVIAADPWSDKNAIKDCYNSNIPIISLCDTNNSTQKIDLVVPCNNKGKKSLATVFYILTKEYLKNKKIIKNDDEFDYEIKDFFEERKKKKKSFKKTDEFDNKRERKPWKN